MKFTITDLSARETQLLLKKDEGQFFDFKRADNLPKVFKTASAFANADGGEILIGIADPKESVRWIGFPNVEATNGACSELSNMFAEGPEFLLLDFFRHPKLKTIVLRCAIQKTQFVVKTPDGRVYVRRGASDKELKTSNEITTLIHNKGILSYEDAKTSVLLSEISSSPTLERFLKHNIPHSSTSTFLTRERLAKDKNIIVAGVVLFDELPQASIPQASVKIYRYRSVNKEGTRDELAGQPITIEGPAVKTITDAVEKTIEMIEAIPALGSSGLEKINYPRDAIHEVVCNAVLHRDYSINDYIHIRIFDNRVEIESPGLLPGQVTVENILRQRFARNKKVSHLILRTRMLEKG